jgi:glycosyltransferase involved in cell wall biosynthesis
MVSSLHIIPDVLSQLGCRTYVISDIKRGGITDCGTTWYQKGTMSDAEKSQTYDFLVYNRQTCNGFSEVKARRRILWTHDIPHGGFIPDPRILNAIDAVVFMSHYAERIWRTHYPGIGRSFLIPNGVDKSLFKPRSKDLNFIIYISAPNRGLGKLPLIYRSIKQKYPAVYLRAFSNMSKLHPQDTDDYSEDYKECKAAGIDLRNPIPQEQLAWHLSKASMMILPTNYPEICSNSILQAIASGVPVLTTGNLGSAHEWIRSGYNGFLTRFQPCDYWVFELELTRFAMSLLENPKKHKRLIRNTSATKLYTWQQIGGQWKKMLKKLY